MSSFSIDSSKIRIQASEIDAIKGKVRTIQRGITQISRSTGIEGHTGREIQRSLSAQSARMDSHISSLDGLSDGLKQAASLYEKTERKVKGSFSSVNFELENVPGGGSHGGSAGGSSGGGHSGGGTGGGGGGGWGDDDPRRGAVLEGAIGGGGSILGFSSGWGAAGEIFGYSYDTESGIGLKYKTDENGNRYLDEAGISWGAKGEGHIMQGEVEGNIGYASGSASGKIGEGSASGKVGVKIWDDGELAPQLYAEGKAGVTAAKGEAKGQVGSDNNNLHAKGEGSLGKAGVNAEAGAGKITYKDSKTGEEKTEYGVKGSVGAEAYAAEGKVSGGFTILGVDVDIGLSGKAGGAGAKIGGEVGTGGASGDIGLGLGLGAELNISIDWSDFHFGW